MTMLPSDAAEVLGRALREDRLVALVGSRVSAKSRDTSGRSYDGLPTPAEFVELCARQFRYVSDSETFNGACDTVLDRDGRPVLEELLLRYYEVPEAFEIPPAHKMLSWLPFSFFITSNYDQFLERALERESKSPHILIENSDLVRLKRRNTPVVKYHGCVTRPNTLVGATADYENLSKRRVLLRDYVAANLAGKTLLVVVECLRLTDPLAM